MPPATTDQSKETCPLCSSFIQEYLINFDTKLAMCENVKCAYPFNTDDTQQFIMKTAGQCPNNDNTGNSSGSDNGINSTMIGKGKKREKPQLDHTQKSVNGKKQETTYSLTSPIEQKDKPLVLALPSKPITTGSILATPSVQSPTKRKQPITATCLPPAKKRCADMDSKSATTTTTAAAAATTTTVRQQELSSSTKMESYQQKVSSPTSSYTLADIESLLNDTDEDSGSTVVTPKEDPTSNMNPLVWLDDLFQEQEQNNIKCHPLQTNQELDSLLGLSLF